MGTPSPLPKIFPMRRILYFFSTSCCVLSLILGLSLSLSLSTSLQATHIVGGELTYECLGGDEFQVNLTVYKDCDGGLAVPFDNPAYLTIYNDFGFVAGTLELFNPDTTTLEPVIDGLCLESVPDICVRRGVYSGTTTLDIAFSSHSIVYQRCCRNGSIVNIIDPLESGATYTINVPQTPVDECNNSSPEFVNFPPNIICQDFELVFDHSATDADGDSLVYEFCDPFLGASDIDAAPVIASAPPYDPVVWGGLFDTENPLASDPPMSIDPETGLLLATPPFTGQFVVGICVSEYRDGELLGTVKRDFQFNVTACEIVLVDAGTPEDVVQCEGEPVTIEASVVGSEEFSWFPEEGLSDPNSLTPELTELTGLQTYVLYAVNEAGCDDYDTIVIDFVAPFEVDAGDDVVICGGGSAELTASGGATYVWEGPDGTISDPTSASIVVTPTENATYTVTAFDAEGACSSVDEVSVILSSLEVSVSDDVTVCPGTEVGLQITADGDGVTYYWVAEGDDAISITEDGFFTVSPIETTTYFVSADDAVGCFGESSVTVFVSGDLDPTISDDVTICAGESATLTAGGGTNYSWSPADGLSSATDAEVTASPTETTTYTVAVSDDNGCSGTATVTVTVDAVSDPGFITEGDGEFYYCDGDVASFTSSGSEIADGHALQFVLTTSDEGPFDNVVSTSLDATFSASSDDYNTNTDYYLYLVAGATDDAGNVDVSSPCIQFSGPTHFVLLDPITIDYGDNCNAETGQFTVSFSITGGLPSYDGSDYQVNATSYVDELGVSEGALFGPFQGGESYSISATDDLGCSADVSESSVPCLKLPIELVSFEATALETSNLISWLTASEYQNNHFLLARSFDGSTFETIATIDGAGTTTEDTAYEFVDAAIEMGTTYYQLTQVDQDGTMVTSPAISLNRTGFSTGILSVQPNPAQDVIQIQVLQDTTVDSELFIYDVTGKLMLQQAVGANTLLSIDLTDYPSGLYFARLKAGEAWYGERFVKQ